MTVPYHQIYTVYPQPYLLRQNFTPTQAQLQFAKQSLIEKHKIANGIQQLLFCKKSPISEQEFLSLNQKNLIENERRKYVDFIKKNYNQKIGEELFDMGKLKRKIREFEAKEDEDEERVLFEQKGKNLAEQELLKRKREQKATAGKKKVKTEGQVKEGKSKGAKGKKGEEGLETEKKVQKKQQQVVDEPQEQSNDLDLLNSINDEEEEIEQFNDED